MVVLSRADGTCPALTAREEPEVCVCLAGHGGGRGERGFLIVLEAELMELTIPEKSLARSGFHSRWLVEFSEWNLNIKYKRDYFSPFLKVKLFFTCEGIVSEFLLGPVARRDCP